jgi:hypothetical protein
MKRAATEGRPYNNTRVEIILDFMLICGVNEQTP